MKICRNSSGCKSVIDCRPLVTVIARYPVRPKKFTGMGRIQGKWRAEELREMRILCRDITQQKTETAKKKTCTYTHHSASNLTNRLIWRGFYQQYYSCVNDLLAESNTV
jgi:hypothetical protein